MTNRRNITIMDKAGIPEAEPQRQYYFMDIAARYVSQISAQKGAPLTFHVTTLGCQMITEHAY